MGEKRRERETGMIAQELTSERKRVELEKGQREA